MGTGLAAAEAATPWRSVGTSEPARRSTGWQPFPFGSRTVGRYVETLSPNAAGHGRQRGLRDQHVMFTKAG